MRRSARRRVQRQFFGTSSPTSTTSGVAETADMAGLTVEWRPQEGPRTSLTAWSDMTAYVSDGSITAGRNYELDQFDAGQLRLTLKTTDRLFDPEYAAGAFYGHLLPLRQIRVKATKNSAEYDEFFGYVTDWGQTVLEDAVYVTDVTARDGKALLEQTHITFSAWSLAIEALSPDFWYRFDDTGILADASTHSRDGYWLGTPVLTTGLVSGDTSMAVVRDADNSFTARGFTGLNLGTLNQTFGFEFNTAASTGTLWTVNGAGFVWTCYLIAGKLRFWTSGTSSYYETPDVVNDGEDHTFVFLTSGVGYLDGTAVTMATGSGLPGQLTASGIAAGLPNGAMYLLDTMDGDNAYIGTFDEFWGLTGLLTAAQALALSVAATAPWEGDDTGARVTRVLDAVGWPSALRQIETGISTLSAFSAQDTTVLDYLEQLADTELGDFYFDRDGTLVFTNRHHRLTQFSSTDSQATFGDGHSGVALTYIDVSLPRDEALIWNPVSASREGGSTVVAKDESLWDTYGRRDKSLPTSLDDGDNVIRDRANYQLGRHKNATTRMSSMLLRPRGNVAVWPYALNLGIGDRITVKVTPLGQGAQTQVDQHIERYVHTFSPMFWDTTWTGSPVDTADLAICDDVLCDDALCAY